MAWLYLVLGGFCLSWATLLIKWCQLPSLAVAAWRLTLASLLMSLWSEARPSPGLPTRAYLLGGALLALHFASWIASVDKLPVYLSVSLVTTSPLWVALVARWIWKERISWAGLWLAFLGSVSLSLRNSEQAIEVSGLLLAWVGAWSMAGYLLWARHCQASGVAYAWRVYSWAAGLLVVPALLLGVPLWGYTAEQWACLLAMALVPQLLGHTLILLAVRQGSASRASLSILLEPLGTIALAWMLLGEHLDRQQLLGVSVTLLGLLLIARVEAPGTRSTGLAPQERVVETGEL